ncbi:thioredoxin family protein [Rhizobium oryzicola]|uniref:Thioredoxin family protein n=1 Tax=Rhizobium oryzicola TaxID=1232668 RepID=A0ABT8T026_9HYPH|nr:thioredoxin family protein [Rhizobium oryzicola]MDO1583977.1 thioredoxin family protein [Rhizobium oryzicola]
MAACLFSATASAGEDGSVAPKGVVELFTSQGCASCPPADANLKKLVEQGDVIALSYHVDYWNYVGWTDTMSSKENTERQYGYAHSFGRSSVYTPQAVINGRDHVKGTDLGAINTKIDTLRDKGQGLTVPVQAQMKGDEMEIEIGQGQGRADVVVAYFTRKDQVNVLRGENGGRQMEYWHSVYDVQTVGMWDGQAMKVTLPAKTMGKSKKDGCAILLQSSSANGEPAAILGAAMVMAGRKRAP